MGGATGAVCTSAFELLLVPELVLDVEVALLRRDLLAAMCKVVVTWCWHDADGESREDPVHANTSIIPL